MKAKKKLFRDLHCRIDLAPDQGSCHKWTLVVHAEIYYGAYYEDLLRAQTLDNVRLREASVGVRRVGHGRHLGPRADLVAHAWLPCEVEAEELPRLQRCIGSCINSPGLDTAWQ